MLRPLLILAFVTLGWSPAWSPLGAPAAAQSKFTSAAFVNDSIITEYDVEQRERLMRAAGDQGGRDAALQSLIDEKLKRQAGREAGISAPEDALGQALQAFAARLGTDPQQLETRLQRAGVSPGALRDFLETDVIWGLLIRRRYGAEVEVTEADVDAEIDEGGLTEKVTYNIGELSIPNGRNAAAARARAAEIAAEVRGGASFQEQARTHSRSPTRDQGGVVGWVPEERLPPEVRPAIQGLEVGGVTDPLPVRGGVVLLTVFDKRVEEVTVDGETREMIRRRITGQRLEGLANELLEELREAAYIERK